VAFAKALDKKLLWRDIDRDERRKKREKLAELRAQLRRARGQRKEAMKSAVERCRSERLAARERARALRIRGLAELREAARLERVSARDICAVSKGEARSKDAVERRRAELAAAAKYQAEMRRIERGNSARRRAHASATYVERRAESDDEVRSNIPADLASLFERVRRGIKGSARMTRTEAFLRYAEEHPDEVLSVIDDKTERIIRELELQQREALRAARRPHPRTNRKLAQVAGVPF
jgi:uncharacterized FlaG/YvyC family protein